MNIAIIGTGAYSVALANMLAKKSKNIIMWTESDSLYKKYLKDGLIKDIIPGTELPNFVKLTTDFKECLEDSFIVFIATATAYVENVCNNIKSYIKNDTVICIASKGIENNTCSFLSNIAFDVLKSDNITVISGPSFAIDMMNNNPIGLTIAGFNKECCYKVSKVLANDLLKIRIINDLIGIQICGSVKNIIAIASGVIAGLGYSESTQCLLITEALNDIKQLIVSLGGDEGTILTFAGVGDILLTCTSTKSRNYSFGYLIGSTNNRRKIDKYLEENTVEGHYTLKSIYKLVNDKNINMPIIDVIYRVVYEYEDPQLLISFLINKS